MEQDPLNLKGEDSDKQDSDKIFDQAKIYSYTGASRKLWLYITLRIKYLTHNIIKNKNVYRLQR